MQSRFVPSGSGFVVNTASWSHEDDDCVMAPGVSVRPDTVLQMS